MRFTAKDDKLIDNVVSYLHKSRRILVITGAGLSADSGLPTYRGTGGLYQSDSDDNSLPIEVLLSADGFRRDPTSVWRHIGVVEESCRGVHPNRGHAVIAAMENEFDGVWVLTQNIDGLHQKAGSCNVITIHGNIHQLRCSSCSYRTSVESYAGLSLAPLCPLCKESIRPDVVLFGEHLNEQAVQLYERELDNLFDLVFTIGTSSLFSYIRDPVLDAALFDRPIVEINPEPTEVSDIATLCLRLPAELALVAIWERFGGSLP